MALRILRAVLIGPAVVPTGAFIFALASGFRVRESVALAITYGAFSYAGTLILGVPAHFALEKGGLASLGHYLIAGATLGALVPVVFAAVLERVGVPSLAAFSVFGLSGAMVAATCWAIVFGPAKSAGSGPN